MQDWDWAKVERAADKLWLGHSGDDSPVLLAIVYDELYWSNDRLTAFFLSCREEELDGISQWAQTDGRDRLPRCEWTWPQAQAIILRFRHGLTTEMIALTGIGTITNEEINALIDKCLARFPMASQAKNLRTVLGDGSAEITSSAIWKRLSFQYHMFDRLPLSQIMERIQGPAAELGVKITLGVLSAWLGGGRLFRELQQYLGSEEDV